MSKYKNIRDFKKRVKKTTFNVVCDEIIVWDNSLINKLKYNGKFSPIDIEYLIHLIEDDILYMRKVQYKNVD